jgi:hypothetical protein
MLHEEPPDVAPPSDEEPRPQLGEVRHRQGRSILEFFGGGTRGWILYILFVLPVVVVLLVIDAVARLILPAEHPVWMFRSKRAAGMFLGGVVAVLALVVGVGALGGPARGVAGSRQMPPSPTQASGAAPVQGLQSTQVDAPAATPGPQATAPSHAVTVVSPVAGQAGQTPTGRRVVRVANTGGRGVNLQRTPRPGDRVRAWIDGTQLEVLEEGPGSGDDLWLKVRDPAGNIGYVPARYTAPTS